MSYHYYKLAAAGLFAGAVASSGSCHAATFEVDGTAATYLTLSAAVEAAYATEDGPDIINITTNTLSTPDTEVVLSQPITIEGDADGDGVSCTIIVDTATMTPDAWQTLGYGNTPPGTNGPAYAKTYFEFNAVGQVTVNNLKLLTNSPGGSTIARRRVNAVRMYKPMGSGEVGNYTMNNVKISGSTADLEYVELDTNEDLFNNPAHVNRWPNGPHNQGAIIQLEDLPADALGQYNAVLNNCHAGLGQSSALTVMNTAGTAVINGGFYGHVNRDGLNLEGTGITVTGSPTNRLRITQAPQWASEPGNNPHGIRVMANAQVDLIEYADVMTTSSGVNFNIIGGTVNMMRFCRGLGKPDTYQNTMHVTNLGTVNIENTTLNGSGEHANPFQVSLAFDGAVSIKDTIFTSEIPGLIRNDNQDTIGLATISYSAIASDGYTSETLQIPPITYTSMIPETMVTDNITSDSPQYILKAADYDWSDRQGADNPLNGAGNMNVLRPSNPLYLTASSTNGPLWGGVGPVFARIDPAEWMLME